MSSKNISVGCSVSVQDDKKPEFDQLFSGKPCMNSNLIFNVVAMDGDTVTVKSKLAGTFDDHNTNEAHTFDAKSDLFEIHH